MSAGNGHPADDAPYDGDRSPRVRGRPRMDLDRIVGSALELADERGASALTLRSLAERLSTSTATLYRNLSGRQELVDQVVDRLFAEATTRHHTEQDNWSTACRDLAISMFDVVARHPGAAPLLIESIPTGPHAMAFRERCLTLLGADFPPDTALRLSATLGRYVIGMAMQVPGHPLAQQADDARSVDRLRQANPSSFPATRRAMADGLVPLREEFTTGLELLLAGMHNLRDSHH